MSNDFGANLEQFRGNFIVITIYHSSRLAYLPFFPLASKLSSVFDRTVIHNLDEFAIKERFSLLFSLFSIFGSQILKTVGSIEN